MPRTVERLELPPATFQALETQAHQQGIAPPDFVDLMLYRENKRASLLVQLEQEYQTLTDGELARTLTAEESRRLELVTARLNLMEELSDDFRERERRAAEIDAAFDALEQRINALAGQ